MPTTRDAAAVVVVIGSVNTDHVVLAEAFPVPGQTVRGSSARTQAGGKGANQAVAAARAGAAVRLVARVGDDPEGELVRSALGLDGVDVSGLLAVDGEQTGTAWVTVAEQDNTIVVVAGANGHWPGTGDPLADAGTTAAVVLAQLEVPLDVVVRAAAATTGTFVLNAAPAMRLPDALVGRCDVLVVNEHELAVASGTPVPSADATGVQAAHHALRRRGAGAVVTTLGPAGAVVTDAAGTTAVAAVPAEVVDTTGAGDAFTGVLAARLAIGDPLRVAVRWASAAGSLAVRSAGARDSYPDAAALVRAIGGAA